MSTSLCDLPALEQLRLIKSREISATELLEAHLARIDAVEGRRPSTDAYTPDPEDLKYVHAFITVTRERAQAQARAVDEALANGQDPGPLAGLPLAVKDIFCVRGTPSTAGSRHFSRLRGIPGTRPTSLGALPGAAPPPWPPEKRRSRLAPIRQARSVSRPLSVVWLA